MLKPQLLCSFIAGAITVALLFSLHGTTDTLAYLEASAVSQSLHHGVQAHTGSVNAAPQSPATPPFADFPRLIWQTGSAAGITKYTNQSATWSRLNPNHTHAILTDADAHTFVHTHFTHRPSLVHLWDSLHTPVLRADLLRYLLLLSQGGVYSDIDTSCLVPITEWIPPALRLRANAVVGVEYDDTSYKMFLRPMSFNQWTLMAKPGHPIFVRAVDRVLSNLEFLARQKRTTLEHLKLEMVETLEATGPGMISDVVMEVIRDQLREEGQRVDWATFQGLREPTLFGDVLVLPINGFAGHQKHSHSGQKGWGTRLIQHHFGKTWYGGKKNGKS